ncbi:MULTISPECIES: aldo/keto reductase [Streptomyces]|uniref:Aldo/keto reductase n=1 Tax=Streptomyces tsukubensis (strain DSM 42081 / NBRC 108919 / NRRL 18488 / 9993) TaxID=1114943 RepID=I2NAZ4_STRT9|nr:MULTISPECIES: aldo/keto reductase [Streptomyces]AZK97946.1 aldo/keto reductase [Streptomyces tsukubensis]EIF94191.1 oxidoreductase [Streptomyces tsukubensis NRRL18488]MYS68567.1 aldo/keto reductase [Streptomyces sp. SID5473]QKM66129.1 aldo/keto reductase [Streptomyces tsukubensis NRRL18488]TAI42412.1 aldo/keto reductase [Streptomyces tsukubensis]
MRHRFLGSTGLAVSELCLGAMTFGREAAEPEAHAILDRFVEAGGNFVDTADIYSAGASEEILGRWLKQRRRDDLVIATKVRYGTGDSPNDRGLGRKHLIAGVEASLRRLGTDHIDLYQVHAWDPATPLEETLSTLDTLVKSGKVRYLGASNFSGWQLQKALDLSRQHNWERFTALQPLYNLLDRSTEWELVEVARHEGLGVIPWSPLRGGWLSGSIRRGDTAPPAGSRVETAERFGWGESWSAYHDERTWRVLDALFEVSGRSGLTPAQVAIAWLGGRPTVTAPIIGARTTDQLENLLGAAGVDLDPADAALLTEVGDQPLPYPYSVIATDPAQR